MSITNIIYWISLSLFAYDVVCTGDGIYEYLEKLKPSSNEFLSYVTDFTSTNEKPLSGNRPIRDTSGAKSCKKSITTVNGAEACSGKLVFVSETTDDFIRDWSHVVQFMEDEGEFTMFSSDQEVTFGSLKDRFDGGNLIVRPITLDKKYGDGYTTYGTIDLGNKCTTTNVDNCREVALGRIFLPPVVSARLTTQNKFSFQYGTIEIRAALPQGDWVVPELWLLPRSRPNSHHKIILTNSFGNNELKIGGKEKGNKHFYSGFIVGDKSLNYEDNISSGSLTSFHNYKMVWKPDEIRFYFDNKEIGGWSSNKDPAFIDKEPEKIAPFNQEFYIVLGAHVGGVGEFPDDCFNKGQRKPWKDNELARRKSFYDDRENWLNTWDNNTSALKIKYVKVWSL